MTQPQRCYEIREDELIDVFAFLHDAPDFIQEIEGDIREHPCVTHTPAAPATEYTIEQIAEIDNRIRKERKDEREKMLSIFISKAYTRIETVAPMDGIHKGWVLLADVKECLDSLRGGAL